MPRYEINNSKTYKVPKNVKTVVYEGKYIIVAIDYANWIVLETKEQFSIFNFFKEGYSINDLLLNPEFCENDINYVVTQLEAKKFCTKTVHSSTVDERSMHLYLTNKCNLMCPHCYMFSGQKSEEELTFDEICNLLSDYKNIAKGNSLTISGGEPTSRPDFDLIIEKASDLGLEVKVLTNGTLMTPKRVERISKYIHSIQVSIDGFSEESNSIIRGNSNFDKALKTVDLFIRYGIKTSIAITPPFSVLKNHVSDYVNFALYLTSKYKGKNLQIKFAEEIIPGRDINLTKEEKKEYFGYIRQIQENLNGKDFEIDNFARTFYNDTILDNCMFGCFTVASNGNVYFCARTEDLSPIANVRTTSMKEIYEKSKAAEIATLTSNLKPCKECELMYICGGGCRVEEFPELVKIVDFNDLNIDLIQPRKCSEDYKNKFYKLMIQSNHLLYKNLI